MIKTLLIGCGNIGALYDWEQKEDLLTYASAFSTTTEFSVSVYDFNRKQQQCVSERYGFHSFDNPLDRSYEMFDLVCIASPTSTHFQYLTKAILDKVPVICCEKPITYNEKEALELEQLYAHSKSRVLVNYIRRFQPSYDRLQKTVQELLQKEQIQHVEINYKRGFMNNGSHVLDLVQFLTNLQLSFDQSQISESIFDVFPQDPTLSGVFRQSGFDLQVIGHPHTENPVFDCTIEFSEHLLSITNAGNDWNISTKKHPTVQIVSESGAIKRYMLPVMNRIQKMIKDSSINDNFTESLLLNRKLLQCIK